MTATTTKEQNTPRKRYETRHAAGQRTPKSPRLGISLSQDLVLVRPSSSGDRPHSDVLPNLLPPSSGAPPTSLPLTPVRPPSERALHPAIRILTVARRSLRRAAELAGRADMDICRWRREVGRHKVGSCWQTAGPVKASLRTFALARARVGDAEDNGSGVLPRGGGVGKRDATLCRSSTLHTTKREMFGRADQVTRAFVAVRVDEPRGHPPPPSPRRARARRPTLRGPASRFPTRHRVWRCRDAPDLKIHGARPIGILQTACEEKRDPIARVLGEVARREKEQEVRALRRPRGERRGAKGGGGEADPGRRTRVTACAAKTGVH